jgi:hypothetical protein
MDEIFISLYIFCCAAFGPVGGCSGSEQNQRHEIRPKIRAGLLNYGLQPES